MEALCERLYRHPRLVGFFGVLLAVKLYFKLTTGRCHSRRRLDGLTAIVTGGNSGIGKETARDLAQRGARVILACRNLVKAEEAKADIIRTTGNSSVEVRPLDLSSLKSVREFAEEIVTTEPSLHILVNNAGMPGNRGKRSADGFDLCVQINHLGHTLLTVLLLDLLKRSAPARVVFVSSMMHLMYARLDVNDLVHEKLVPYDHLVAYSNTKLCNILTSNHLAKILSGSGVTVNSLHPGAVLTDIWERLPSLPRALVKSVLRLFMKSTEEGAQTTIYLAVSEDVEAVTGKYFSDCKEVAPSAQARNADLARVVFEKSCALVGVPVPGNPSRL
ncbi:retinol dehydrogenase 11-like [Thrips palmi]|uniref:Retinol dehydrogenase 11-like n=1 Tax=Thrips palmi TaxID=161013 RepID=A0A6P9AB02_THRPL|nr:retinol dehydrogenase 11-like [Thrips palmi]XP_034255293.1 retinol dehydrogenase 11-like [Thrips palmi]